MTPLERARAFATITLLAATLLLAACGATAEDPENDPTTSAPATFGDATFDTSTWR